MIPINLLEAYINFYVFALIVYVSNGFVQKRKSKYWLTRSIENRA